MAFKINISTKDGKTYKIEADAPGLKQKQLGDKVQGQEISPDLAGYELEITGASDKAGFTSMQDVPGMALKKVLLDYGKAMHKRPKGDKKINRKPKGLRLRKTVRGKVISNAVVQINTKVVKEGSKPLNEVFADQNKTEAKAPEQEKTESVEESPKQAEKDAELASPEKEPITEKAEKSE
jgi:small subunit ribosomal protein S6e